MKLKVVWCSGEIHELDLQFPLKLVDELETLWAIQDASGERHYFSKDDGSYDGWEFTISRTGEIIK